MSVPQGATKRTPPFPQDGFDIKTRATAEAESSNAHCKPLPKEFRRDGFTYRQIYREGDFAIYEQTWNGCRSPSISYEVIRIRRRDGFQIGGRFVAAGEVYPKAETWGVDGFTLTDKDAAFAKLREISLATTLPPTSAKP